MYAAQALEFRRPSKFSPIVEETFAVIRKKVDKLEDDRVLRYDINNMVEMVKDQVFRVK